MQILNQATAPRYIRDGIVGHLLASPRTCGAQHLATALVTIAPGSGHNVHGHDPEQVYFILDGTGEMTVGEQRASVEAGDCTYVPPKVPHGLHNSGNCVLRY